MPGDDHHANMTPQKDAVKTNQVKAIISPRCEGYKIKRSSWCGAMEVYVELQLVETSVGRSHVRVFVS